MISLAKAARKSMRRMVRRDKTTKRPAAEASSNDTPKVFSPFKRSNGKGANANHRTVTDAATTTLPVTTTAPDPIAAVRPPRKGMRTAVNKIKQHVSDTLERLLTSLRGAQRNLSDSVAKSVKLQQQAQQLSGFVEAAEAAAAQAREQAITAANAVGVLEHIEKQLLEKVKELKAPLDGSSDLQAIEQNLKLQHEAVLQQKTAVMKWYSNAAEAQAVQERGTKVVGVAREEYDAAQRDLAAAAAALYEAQRATLAAKQMIMQAVTRAHLDDLREESGDSLEEEQLVLAERDHDVVVVGHVSLAEKLRMEQGEIWQEVPAELADVYGHLAVMAQREDYEQAKAAAVEATQQREAVAKLAEEIAAMADGSSSPLYILTGQALERQVAEEMLHREEADNRVKYLSTRLNWVRLAAAGGAADDHPWVSGMQLPDFAVDTDPTVVGAIERLNIAKADLMATERKLARLQSIAQLQSSYATVTGKHVAAGESVVATTTQLMKSAVLAEIRAYRNAKYAQQSVQEACEAVQVGVRHANGEKATPELSLSRMGLEPKRLQYFMQYYLEALPKRLSTRPRVTTPASPRKTRTSPPTSPTIPPPSFSGDPTPLPPSIPSTSTPAPTTAVLGAVRVPSPEREGKPDADIARVRAALQGFLDKDTETAMTSSSTAVAATATGASRPSPSFDPVETGRPGRLGASRQLHPLAGTRLEVSAAKTLEEALQIDSALLDSVRSRLALAQLLERADSKVVRELVNSQFAADTEAVPTPITVIVEQALPVVEVAVELPELDAGVSQEEALDRIRHYYALQYMLERASKTAASSASAPLPASSAPIASFALSSFSDDDTSSVTSRRSSLDFDVAAAAHDVVPDDNVVALAVEAEEEVVAFVSEPSAREVAPEEVEVAVNVEEEVITHLTAPTAQTVAAVEEVAAVSVEEQVVTLVTTPAVQAETPVEVVAPVEEPVVVMTEVAPVVAAVPEPVEMAQALAMAVVEETSVSSAGNLVKKGPKKVKKSALVTARSLTLPSLPKFEFTPPTWIEIRQIVQERGELTGSLLALSIASWGAIVGTHMDSAAVVSTVYLAAGVAAMSAVNRQTAIVAAKEAALAAEREAAEREAAERAAAEAAALAAARAAAEREAAEAAERAAALAAAEAAAAQAIVAAVEQPAAESASPAKTFMSKMWKSFKKALSPTSSVSKSKAPVVETAPIPVAPVVSAESTVSVAAAVVADTPIVSPPSVPAPVKIPSVMAAAVMEEDASDYATPTSALSSASSLDAASMQTAESVLKEEEDVVKGSAWQRAKTWFNRENHRRPELTGSVLALALGSLGCFTANVVH